MPSFGPIVPPSGPFPCRIAVVGEAPGEEESQKLAPFVGASGGLLRSMMKKVGLELHECFLTNVFSRRPEGNNIALFTVDSNTASSASRALGPLSTNPIGYLSEDWRHELDRLREELRRANPNLILALGNTACWALLGQQGIGALRGSIATSDFLGPDRPPVKVLPTYHPAAVFQQWNWLTVLTSDLEKARVECDSPQFQYDNTALWLCPTLDDLHEFGELHMANATICAADVETKRGQITCLSFAPMPDVAIVVPFWVEGADPNYWPDLESEKAAWRWVQHWLEKPNLVKVHQNGLYDVQMYMRHGMRPMNCSEDTMLAHHSLYSELQKGLGFLGSIYTNAPSWKMMRTYKLDEAFKRDD